MVQVDSFTNLRFNDYDGVVVVGGENANPIYSELVDRLGWTTPKPENERNFLSGKPDSVVATSIQKFQGVVVQGLAGYTENDTNNLIDAYVGDIQGINFNLDSPIDKFIEEANANDSEESDDDEEVSDPADPIVEDPEDMPNVPDLPTKIKVQGVKLNLPDVEDYSMQISGWAKEVDSKFSDLGSPQGVSLKDNTWEGKTGGGDKDVYVMEDDGEIVDFSADSDKYVSINGERYKYLADRDQFEGSGIPLINMPSDDTSDKISDDEKTDEQKEREEERREERNETLVDEFVDTFENPTEPENILRIVLILFLFYTVTQSSTIVESVR